MPIESATEFDRKRDFNAFHAAEPVGAARWIAAIMRQTDASVPALEGLAAMLRGTPDAAQLAPLAEPLKQAGALLSVPMATFDAGKLKELGWSWPEQLRAPMVRGTLKLEPTTTELGKRLSLRVGPRERPLVCADDPLECFAGDLNPFVGCYSAAVVGWPDDAGQIFVEEAAPLMTVPGLGWSDWAQGRLFDNGDRTGPVVLRVNKDRQIRIVDEVMQEKLRPFVGTGVALYGQRRVAADGVAEIREIHEDLWFLTRLTNPADSAAAYPGAPRPVVIGTRALCIGATPPWNWQGPNVETHLLAPLSAASLFDTEGRRIVFGRPVDRLPDGWANPVPHVTRVVDLAGVAEAAIDTAAHIATRRAPRGVLNKTIRGIAELTSAEQHFQPV